MNGMMKATRGTGKVVLALVVGVLMPILIWVALGVALNKKLHGETARETRATTIGEVLTKAGEAVKR